MSRDRDPRRTSHLLPAGCQRCVWMTAGMVAFKLCDRDFDCETCPLDLALRGGDPRRAAAVAAPGPAGGPEFPDDRRYARRHTWARRGGPGRLRIGLDAFAAGLLGPPISVIVPPEGSPLIRGEAGCWLLDEAGPLPVRMPVSGVVAAANPALRGSPGLAAEEPYGAGWLMEARCPDPDAALEALLSAEEMTCRTATDRERLRRRAEGLLRHSAQGVGATLPDGGVPTAGLREALGAARYRRLLLTLLA